VSYAERWQVDGASDQDDVDRRFVATVIAPPQQEIIFPEAPRKSPRGVILEEQPALATILSRSSHPAAELLAAYLSEEEHITVLAAIRAQLETQPSNDVIHSLCQKLFPTLELSNAPAN
jgi:hypothetical protein